jgi:D-alanyl-lipoteichoic acid acyltransferase DltB (MBOAT superfamily)
MQVSIPAIDVILPVGISFYTFQALSYTVDVYRKEIYAERNFFKYALFVSFFPQLVAGPIERSKNLLIQINERHKFDFERIRSGLLLMLYGYFQKVVLAEYLAIVVDTVYDNYTQRTGFQLLVASIAFAFQIYCDFGSYSNIAIGAARVMGFNLMENFNTPYFAVSVADFWRRWHISLSTWFRDYLYIPLGGNRKGKVRKWFNLMVVFLVSGLWHGASGHYVIWGGLNGAYQIIGEWLRPLREKIMKLFRVDKNAFSHKLLQMIITFGFVDASWIFFRATFRQALSIGKRIVGLGGGNWFTWGNNLEAMGLTLATRNLLIVSLLILLIVDLCKYNKINLIVWITKQGLWFRWLIYFTAIFGILIFGVYGPGYDASQFIYFQF